MKYLKSTFFLLTLGLFSVCNQSGNVTTAKSKAVAEIPFVNTRALLEDLKNRVVELYKWNEVQSSHVDFEPLLQQEMDSVYVGLDLARHEQRLAELRETNFFTDHFVENYDQIARTIDEKLKDKSKIWYVGELPPFGNGANPWCNCQDNPDKYWENITLKNVHMSNGDAIFSWSWGCDFGYKAKAVLDHGLWKIDYLEGFDPKTFIASE